MTWRSDLTDYARHVIKRNLNSFLEFTGIL